MRNAEKFNPMRSNEAINLSAGKHVSTKGHSNSRGKGNPGKGLGPGIAKGYLVTGTGDTRATGGPFRKANTAKRSKGSTKKAKKA